MGWLNKFNQKNKEEKRKGKEKFQTDVDSFKEELEGLMTKYNLKAEASLIFNERGIVPTMRISRLENENPASKNNRTKKRPV